MNVFQLLIYQMIQFLMTRLNNVKGGKNDQNAFTTL